MQLRFLAVLLLLATPAWAQAPITEEDYLACIDDLEKAQPIECRGDPNKCLRFAAPRPDTYVTKQATCAGPNGIVARYRSQ